MKSITEKRIADILHCLRTGATSDKAIARRLEISPWTVQTYIKQISSRLGIRGRIELALHAERQHIKEKLQNVQS